MFILLSLDFKIVFFFTFLLISRKLLEIATNFFQNYVYN